MYYIFLGAISLFLLCHGVYAQEVRTPGEEGSKFPYADVLRNGEENEIVTAAGATDEFRDIVQDEIIGTAPGQANPERSYFREFLKLFSLDGFTALTKGPGSTMYTGPKAVIAFIFNILNLVIALSSFIALIFLIYGFYGLFFSSDDDGYSKAKTIVQNTAIALAIIGISFFITTMLTYVYNIVVR